MIQDLHFHEKNRHVYACAKMNIHHNDDRIAVIPSTVVKNLAEFYTH